MFLHVPKEHESYNHHLIVTRENELPNCNPRRTARPCNRLRAGIRAFSTDIREALIIEQGYPN